MQLMNAQRARKKFPARGPLGVDVARYGDDMTVFAVADESGVREMYTASGLSTMETAGRVIALARQYGIPPSRIAIDDAGVGGGVTDRLREQGLNVQGVNAASSPLSGNFANRRSELYWTFREALNPDAARPLALPARFDRLTRELSEIRYHFNSRGRIQIESKDTLRSRLGASPDMADAVILAFSARLLIAQPPRIWEV